MKKGKIICIALVLTFSVRVCRLYGAYGEGYVHL